MSRRWSSVQLVGELLFPLQRVVDSAREVAGNEQQRDPSEPTPQQHAAQPLDDGSPANLSATPAPLSEAGQSKPTPLDLVVRPASKGPLSTTTRANGVLHRAHAHRQATTRDTVNSRSQSVAQPASQRVQGPSSNPEAGSMRTAPHNHADTKKTEDKPRPAPPLMRPARVPHSKRPHQPKHPPMRGNGIVADTKKLQPSGLTQPHPEQLETMKRPTVAVMPAATRGTSLHYQQSSSPKLDLSRVTAARGRSLYRQQPLSPELNPSRMTSTHPSDTKMGPPTAHDSMASRQPAGLPSADGYSQDGAQKTATIKHLPDVRRDVTRVSSDDNHRQVTHPNAHEKKTKKLNAFDPDEPAPKDIPSASPPQVPLHERDHETVEREVTAALRACARRHGLEV